MRKLLFLAVLLPCIAAAQNADTQNPFHWSGAVGAGQTLGIKNVNGDIKVEAASGNQAEVTATRSGSGSKDIRIQVVPSGEGVTFCAIFPDGEGGPASTCESGTEWSVHQNGRNNNDARVDFVVRIPHDVKLIVRDVNGSVKATHLGEVADATTVNGSVSVDTAQWAHLSTVNGEITGHFGRADWSDQLSINTVNGDINLDVPSDFSADFEFNAVNGSFHTDLPANIEDSGEKHAWGPKHVRGTIGNGGRQLKLHTVNGSARVSRGTV